MRVRKWILSVLHILVIVLAGVLIYGVTSDTLRNVSLLTDHRYLQLQFWVCMFFIFELFMEWLLFPHKLRRLPGIIALMLVCVPYISIIHHLGWHVPLQVYYLLRVMPVVRAAVVLVVMWGLMEKDWVTGVFGIYIIMLVISVYVLSLLFYVEEHAVNTLVDNYWKSLWYSVMQMNTCGSNISPVTPMGKVIGIVLSLEGLILFPVFTVFFTKAFSHKDASPETD